MYTTIYQQRSSYDEHRYIFAAAYGTCAFAVQLAAYDLEGISRHILRKELVGVKRIIGILALTFDFRLFSTPFQKSKKKSPR